MKAWLVNDCLSALGERTFWHDLLDLGLEDRTGGYTQFSELASKIESEARHEKPDLIVRNGSYFRHINVDCRQIAFIQDIPTGHRLQKLQREVIQECEVVCNSKWTAHEINCFAMATVIPIGVDFDLFKPHDKDYYRVKHNIPKNTVLFVGSSTRIKGWKFLQQLIQETNFSFAIVTKDGARFEHPRVTNFGKVSQEKLVEIMNACACLVCTSHTETQHLAGIEAAACGLPLVVPDIGIYYGADELRFGTIVKERTVAEYKSGIERALEWNYDPREYFFSLGCHKLSSMAKWRELIG
jgi:glycosyltransferase involved in cell wall biosynthesis